MAESGNISPSALYGKGRMLSLQDTVVNDFSIVARLQSFVNSDDVDDPVKAKTAANCRGRCSHRGGNAAIWDVPSVCESLFLGLLCRGPLRLFLSLRMVESPARCGRDFGCPGTADQYGRLTGPSPSLSLGEWAVSPAFETLPSDRSGSDLIEVEQTCRARPKGPVSTRPGAAGTSQMLRLHRIRRSVSLPNRLGFC